MMDKQNILIALQWLDEALESSCDLILTGGTAMLLHFGSSRATPDIDVLLARGDSAEVQRAVQLVARQHRLAADWMNNMVNGYSDLLPRDFYHHLVPLDTSLRHIRLYALGLPDQVAMKIVAGRKQDKDDLGLLLPRMTDRDRERLITIMRHAATIAPHWALKIQYFLLEQGWMIE